MNEIGTELDALVGAVTELVRQHGPAVSPAQVRDALWAAGVADALEDLAVARAVVRAADGFHPVARFFVEGSVEREFIERTLRGT